jgi:uncharacterized protein with PQ loop repeat
MDKMILIINWIIYGGLFFTFFIKLTDEKERDFARKIAYGLLMLCTLFFSVALFKESFVFEGKPQIKFNLIETIFNGLILFFMWTKVKEDKMFSNLKKK